MQSLKGTGIAIVTPFNADGTIDYATLERLINYWIAGGVEYLVVMGTTGESVVLDKQEKVDLFDFCAEKIAGRVPLVIGLGGNYTAGLFKDFDLFDLSKASAVLSVSPYYNKPNATGLLAHFGAVAKKSPLPVILYNVPSRTGSNVPVDVTLKLAAEYSNIVAVKEASGNLEQVSQIIKDRLPEFLVLSGDDNLTLPILASGGDGVISVVANAYPRVFSDMVRYALADDFVSARKLHYHLFDFTKLLFADGNPGGIKTALNEMGFGTDEVRLPLAKPTDSVAQAIRQFVRANT